EVKNMDNKKQLEKIKKSIFEKIKQTNEYEQEFWFARDLQKILNYKKWDNFLTVVAKAKEACKNSNHKASNHFAEAGKMVQIGSGTKRKIKDIKLTRYACYLIVQNADPSKEIVALGQTYFAVQTRKQELAIQAEFQKLTSEENKRLFLRDEMKTHNKQLAGAAKKAGVIEPLDHAIFQDHGYKGLYEGLGAKDIRRKKELKKTQAILDHMNSEELAANLFRATQTESKLRRENTKGKYKANLTHFQVGQKVRQTIKE
ncbi:unnamed protein product, partial [marine sediment metagenome]